MNDEEISGDRPGTFTSICLNVNYAANLHVDKNNYDFSYIVGLGEYTGGQLFIADPEGNDTHAETDQNGTKIFRKAFAWCTTVRRISSQHCVFSFPVHSQERAKCANLISQIHGLGFP